MSASFREDEQGAQARLLIIDDDIKLCRLLREYLEPLGYSIDQVHNERKDCSGFFRAATRPLFST